MSCDACNKLRADAAQYYHLGLNDAECNSLFKNTGLNPKRSPLSDNCTDIHNIIDCNQTSLTNKLNTTNLCDNHALKSFLQSLTNNFTVTDKAIQCSLCGAWYQIDLLWEEISNIYTAIQDLAGGIYQDLTHGVDYTTTIYNNFELYTGMTIPTKVGFYTIQDYYFIRAYSDTNNGAALMNLDLKQIQMRHSSPAESVPESWIYGITFIGDYSFLNNYRYANVPNVATGIWNVRNAETVRGSAQAGCVLTSNVSGSGSFLVATIANYADLMNSQFNISAYPSPLPSWNLNISIEGILRP